MKVAIDPGHGMGNATPSVYDPGAVAIADRMMYAEADIVLQYGLTLNFLLKERGIATFMTRTSSADEATVGTRALRAEAAGCTPLRLPPPGLGRTHCPRCRGPLSKGGLQGYCWGPKCGTLGGRRSKEPASKTTARSPCTQIR